LVVDALDLCYTKSHVDTFVIISGDSDFSPLVSKLRENAKRVIGVGVKQSCSDLLIANCDEFIYYDDLVRDREAERNNASRRENREPAPRRTPEEEKSRREKLEARKDKAVELVATTFADLSADRGEQERIWASVLKEVIKRRNPGFNETYFGFRSFGNLLEEAANRGLLGFGRDDKSGAYVTRAQPKATTGDGDNRQVVSEPVTTITAVDAEKEAKTETPPDDTASSTPSARRRGGRRSRKENDAKPVALAVVSEVKASEPVVVLAEAAAQPGEEAVVANPRRRAGRRPRKEVEAVPVPVAVMVETATPVEAPKKRAPRSRKPKVVSE
ncbi:MAG TPA: NYN domain-containing protein, partial [Azonexus sp.]|nr:NYN domain-containing protein [Azonexus sp.]